MKVYPQAQVKTLADCWPGQLVRSLEYGQKDRFGVVFEAKNGELRGIVMLTGDVPTFVVEDHPEELNVLAYSGEVVWEIDQAGPLETNARSIFDKIGSIVCHKDGWLLNVSLLQASGISESRMQLNLGTGVLERYQERLQKVAIFGGWSVFLEERARPNAARVPLSCFKIKE